MSRRKYEIYITGETKNAVEAEGIDMLLKGISVLDRREKQVLRRELKCRSLKRKYDIE